MANPAKQKGTGGEREVLLRLQALYGEGFVKRTSPGSAADIVVRKYESLGGAASKAIPVLYTRPDHGRWLVTLPASDFEDLLWHGEASLDIQVKRYARFSFHTIFEGFVKAVQA